MSVAEFNTNSKDKGVIKFSPKVIVYHPWSATALKRFLEIEVPDASVSAEVGITGVLTALDKSSKLPDAYFIDAPIFGADKTCVEQAVEFLTVHKSRMENGKKQPDIFLLRSSRSGESAKEIVDRTGFSVFHLREEIFELLNAHGDITDFQFLKDSFSLVIPSVSRKSRERAPKNP